MRNICFFDSVKFWGGGEKLHLEYALELKKRNYEITLLSGKDSPLSKIASIKGFDISQITVKNLSFLNPFKIIRLVRFYKKKNIDTVIFSASQDLKLGSISAKLAGVKNIVYLRGLAVPIKSDLINYIIFKFILTKIVANSEETKRMILQNLGKYIENEKVKTIYHGIDIQSSDLNDYQKLDEIVTKGRGVILGNAGRLTPQKGQQDLIEVARRLKENHVEFTLFIAGTGEMKAELESLIENNDLQEEVILLGFVKEMDCFMNSIDIFLQTSISEGFGYVLVEAMIKSKPVVAFNMSSSPEIVTEDETGFLVKYHDIEMFSQKTQLLIQDEALRRQFGENGKKSVIKRFNISDRITDFELLFSED